MFWNLDYDRFFFNRKTAVAFGLAAVLSVGAIVLRQTTINLSSLSHPALVGISLVGAAAAIGAFSLLVGMWFFWVRCDVSPKWQRGAWFFVLLFGLFYGAVLYYLIVYLPGVKKALNGRRGGAW